MASPFTIFRKHEKKLIATLAILAMFAFIVVGPGMSIPGLLELFGLRDPAAGGEVFARTSWGTVTRADVANLVARREAANQFVINAQLASGLMPRTPYHFGEPSEQDALYAELVRRKAQELGVRISDDAVRFFIDQITARRLSTEQFEQIRRRIGVGGPTLIDILREELVVLEVMQMVLGGWSAVGPSGTTPHELWQNYQKLDSRVSLEIAEVPVEDFTDQVEAPSDEELQGYFEKYKNELPDPTSPEPGFKQPRRVRVEYVMANFDLIAAEIEVTDEEVRDFYEKNKDTLYRLPDEPPADEADAATEESKPAEDRADAPEQAGDDAPDASQSQAGETEDSQPEATPTEEDGDSADSGEQPSRDAADEATSEADATAEESPSEPTASGGQEADEEQPSPSPDEAVAPNAAGERDGDSIAVQAEGAEDGPASADEAVEDTTEDDGKPRYRPLDAELASQIHDQLQRQKAREEINERLDSISFEVLEAFGQRYSNWASRKEAYEEDPEGPAEPPGPEPQRPDLKAVAEERGLEYGLTPPVSPEEAEKLTGLGSARREAFEGPSFVEQAFADRPLFSPLRVKELNDNSYLFWVIESTKEHVPEFADVRELVLEAWKLESARSAAQARAEELAELARSSDQPLSEALAGQEGIVVTTTPMFSWLRRGMLGADPFNRPVEQSQVPGVDQPGEEFMEATFGLSEGAIDVAPDAPKKHYYVLRAVRREPAGREQFRNETFFSLNPSAQPTPYEQLAAKGQSEVLRQWLEDLEEEYRVQWVEEKPERLAEAAGV